jgi:hypothetical protein
MFWDGLVVHSSIIGRREGRVNGLHSIQFEEYVTLSKYTEPYDIDMDMDF